MLFLAFSELPKISHKKMNISIFETEAGHEKSPARVAGLRFLSNSHQKRRENDLCLMTLLRQDHTLGRDLLSVYNQAIDVHACI